MSPDQSISMADRASRIETAVGTVTICGSSSEADSPLCDKPWIAVVSSRLGHNPTLHRDVCRTLVQSMIDCRRREAVLLLAKGTAIYPWAKRAAELFQVRTIELVTPPNRSPNGPSTLSITSTTNKNLSIDRLMIFLADRVDALYVRRKGTIASAVSQRVEQLADATTRVAVTSLPDCAAKGLIQAGAIGWLAGQSIDKPPRKSQNIQPTLADVDSESQIEREGEWLVHCTRTCAGPWPQQTDQQYRDNLLLGIDQVPRTAFATLERIVRSRRLLASAVASAKAFPVVCFSSVPLAELLVSRAYRPHLQRWDYEPWGIAIRKSAAIQRGIEAVIYGPRELRKTLATRDLFRFQSVGKTYDWTAENEWRSSTDVDLDTFDRDDIRVFVASEKDAKTLKKHCPWPIRVV